MRRTALTVLSLALTCSLFPEVPGQWGTTDTSRPGAFEWPTNWYGAKNQKAQYWKLLCRDPEKFKIEDFSKGYDPNNTAFNWRGAEPVPVGTKILLEGDFPYARMFTLQIGAPWDPEFPYQGRGAYAPEVIIIDEDIEPDPGSINPYREGADRYAKKRHYHVTFELVEGKWALNGKAGIPPFRAKGNHRYGGNRSYLDGSSGPSVWVYIHLPDRYEPYGGVEPPLIRIQYPGKDPVVAPITQDIPIELGKYLKTTPSENPAMENGRSVIEQKSLDTLRDEAIASMDASKPGDTFSKGYYSRHTNPDGSLFIIKKFGTMRQIQWGSRFDDIDWIRNTLPLIMKKKYRQDKSLPPPGNLSCESDHHPPTAYMGSGITLTKDTCLVITGKAPNTPRTRSGERTMGSSKELRYWMMHWDIGRKLPLFPIGTICDEDVVLDADRNYMIVISTPEARPANANAESGITWNPHYFGPAASLSWEIVSTADPYWKHAPHTIPWEKGDYVDKTFYSNAVKEHMAEYYPNARYMKRSAVEALGTIGKGPYIIPERPKFEYDAAKR